ncbi:MAG TPA: ComF family protein [Caulobacteraceae bacterium]|nr:ComF family protein [Caulobacteraceae bacterium]
MDLSAETTGAVLAGAAARARRLARGVLDVVMPPLAFDGGRGAAAMQSPGLSADAWGKVTFLEAPVCDGCGAPQVYEAGERCPACLAKSRAFDRARAAVAYDDASRDLILKLKRADRTDLAALFALWLSRAARDLIEDSDVVVPVPLHPWRLVTRRFNQAAEIARPLARRAGLAYAPDVLIRRRDTPTQGGRSASGRRRNVQAAFAVPQRAWSKVVGRRVLLVDDVLTTGATAEGCARVLKAAGAGSVALAAVARVQERELRPI